MVQARTTDRDATGDRSLSGLFAGILDDMRHLMAQQLELFKVEIRGELIKLAMGLGFVAIGAGFSMLGGLLLCFMCVYLLHDLAGLEMWLSYFIVGGVFLLFGLTMGLGAYQRLRSFRPLPEQSLTALKENFQWKTTLN